MPTYQGTEFSNIETDHDTQEDKYAWWTFRQHGRHGGQHQNTVGYFDAIVDPSIERQIIQDDPSTNSMWLKEKRHMTLNSNFMDQSRPQKGSEY